MTDDIGPSCAQERRAASRHCCASLPVSSRKHRAKSASGVSPLTGSSQRPQSRDGVPVLRAVSASQRIRQHRRAAADGPPFRGGAAGPANWSASATPAMLANISRVPPG